MGDEPAATTPCRSEPTVLTSYHPGIARMSLKLRRARIGVKRSPPARLAWRSLPGGRRVAAQGLFHPRRDAPKSDEQKADTGKRSRRKRRG